MSEYKTPHEEINVDPLEEFVVYFLDQTNTPKKFESSIKARDIYNFDMSAFLPNEKPLTLERFFKITADILEDHQKKAGIIVDERVLLSEEHPPDYFGDDEDEIITWRVLNREPANMDTKAQNRPQRKSSYYYNLQSSEWPNKVVLVESRPVDHKIEFTCWAKTNRLANKRAIWFEKLMISNSWAFEVQGAERFLWLNRGPDMYTTHQQQRLFGRPLNFMLRFREHEATILPVIKQIELEFSLER